MDDGPYAISFLPPLLILWVSIASKSNASWLHPTVIMSLKLYFPRACCSKSKGEKVIECAGDSTVLHYEEKNVMLLARLFLQITATSSLTALLCLQKKGCFLSLWISHSTFPTYPGSPQTILDAITQADIYISQIQALRRKAFM